MMKKYFFPLCVFVCAFFMSCKAEAQYTYSTKNKKAIKFFEAALDAYNKFDDKAAFKNIDLALKAEPKFGEAYILQGTIYYEKKDLPAAEQSFLNAVAIDSKEFADGYRFLGDLYHVQFMFGKSYKAYIDYLEKGKIKKQETRLVYERKAYADYISDSLVTHPVPFEPINMGPEINSELSEYHPSLTADGSFLMYTVLLKDANPNCPGTLKTDGEENFYFSKKKGDSWMARQDAGSPLNTVCNEGAANLSPDGRFLFFYSARDRENPYARDPIKDIYYAEKEGNNWGTPQRLPEPVSSGSFDSQPSFSSDGKTLYFTSDRPGGLGGNDIWKTTKNADGTWTQPENLGRNINTGGNEISPFIHPDNQTFYFGSDGRYGVGGTDFYYARLDENGEFSEAKNMGSPINTPYEERSLVISADGQRGYFASTNLQGMGGYDLYYFDLYKDAQPVYTTYLKGHIFDSKSKGSLYASFELIDVETGKIIVSSFSDKLNGEFLVSIPQNRKYALNVSSEGYLFHSETFDMEVSDHTKPYLLDIGLNKIDLNIPIVLRNIFFDTDKFDLKSESTVELNKLVDFLNKNPRLKIEISGHTDNVGNDQNNMLLSTNRAKSVYDYLVSHGIVASRLSYKGYGENAPIADNATEEGRAQNRRTEFKVTGL